MLPQKVLTLSLRSLRISVISALNIPRDKTYAEITEIRRDRREAQKRSSGHFAGQRVRLQFSEADIGLRDLFPFQREANRRERSDDLLLVILLLDHQRLNVAIV